jgi:hypothetical protein
MLTKFFTSATLKVSAIPARAFASGKFAKYDYEDALNLNSLLTEDEKMVKKQIFSKLRSWKLLDQSVNLN